MGNSSINDLCCMESKADRGTEHPGIQYNPAVRYGQDEFWDCGKDPNDMSGTAAIGMTRILLPDHSDGNWKGSPQQAAQGWPMPPPPPPQSALGVAPPPLGFWDLPLQAGGSSDLPRLLADRRNLLVEKEPEVKRNRYGRGKPSAFPPHVKGRHVPLLALIHTRCGSKVGAHILSLTRHVPVHSDRFFNVTDVLREERQRGGLLDLFRAELNVAKEEAQQMGARPRVIVAGDDDVASMGLAVILKALRADETRISDGLRDAGNGFIWSDEELAHCFPALAPMPLGLSSDFAANLGWGRRAPGTRRFALGCFARKRGRRQALLHWLEHCMNPATQVGNFDLWGIMPPSGDLRCDFKWCELDGRRGRTPKAKVGGKKQLQLKPPSSPAPLGIFLYASAGFSGYLGARTRLNSSAYSVRRRFEGLRQAVGVLLEQTPPQLRIRTDGVSVECHQGISRHDREADHSKAKPYFPPRPGRKSRKPKGYRFREVGFHNVAWQGHFRYGADRAGLLRRLCCCGVQPRRPIRFNDGLLDMYRMRMKSFFKNPGRKMQTDKQRDMLLTFTSDKAQGLFVQFDSEFRFLFSPTGGTCHLFIRKIMNIPVVAGPSFREKSSGAMRNGEQVRFEFHGDTPEDKARAGARVLAFLRGEVDAELNASTQDIVAAGLPIREAQDRRR